MDNDLRPVTLTPILSKCYEQVMLPKLKSHVMPLIDKLQFAYLEKRSTEDAINTLLHFTSHHLDQPKSYARCLFIDYSSAFNTIQPHILLQTLDKYNVPANLQLFILDFLTDRQQYVKTSQEKSSLITTNTGCPQGCVLSAFLFVLYTNQLCMNNNNVKIIKYADDTVVIGLIHNDDETEYRNGIDFVSEWCNQNYLDLNVTKTKELIMDFRRKKNNKDPININNSPVSIVPEYKYLGCIIKDDLTWDAHVTNQLKKANKRFYHVRCLRKLNVNSKIIALFYNSVVSSVLLYAVACWYNNTTEEDKKEINKLHKKVKKMMDTQFHDIVDNPANIHQKQCLSLTKRIMSDATHPLHYLFTMLPSRRRLNVMYTKTDRSHNAFVATAIRLYNSQ